MILVDRYEQLLNADDTTGVLDLSAPESVAEWNDKPTFALFKVAKFSTVFGYARIDASADKPARLRLDLRLRSHPAQELLGIGQEGEHRGAAPGCAARGGR
jgi:hypothetical protein